VQDTGRLGWAASDDFHGVIGRMPRGMLKYAVLFLINERETHGYELLVQIKARRWGAPGPGSVYPLLGALESHGLITGRDEDGRRIYRITEDGRQTLLEHSRRLREFTSERHSVDEQPPETEEGKLHRSASKLMQTITHMSDRSQSDTLTKISGVLDQARRDIYNILADE
jgi:DNA-binding PadR family transcriptional regulator